MVAARPPAASRRSRRGHHQRAARAVGGLHAAGLEAGLAEERRVRVTHKCPDGHACRQRSRATLSPKTERDGRISGSAAMGTPKASQRSWSQAPASMSMSGCARRCSVRARHGTAREYREDPAVHRSHAEFRRPRPGPGHAGRVQQPARLAGREHGIEGSPVRACCDGAWPWARRRSQRLCRATALPGDRRSMGAPVARSQATPVSRWLEMPMAARAGEPAAARHSSMHSRTACQMRAGVLLHPAGLRVLDGHRP